ncbi:phage major capsid protein [Heliobacterium chlorum]|uniref:Phage major capsid protein n=1 Tax=Heliobacterium chlorum TaxID=2698 RepID=A0ABR7T428_HELCL|nr:phage major capsid protein [Heliobacterium chlorum]MBC9785100.1 phage major capsid protein [Heliobacterium chlorum]
MALTLLEAAKLSNDVLQRGVIQTFARNSAILEMLPWMEIAGNSYKYNQEQTLPGIAFRTVNNGYTESCGVVNQLSEGLYILGGDVDVDKFLIQTRGNVQDIRAIHTEMKAKALALEFTRAFFKGDAAQVGQFDGLQKRLTGTQVIDGKDEYLKIGMIDELIDAVEGEPDALFMSKTMRRELKKVLQNSKHYIENGSDAFGRPVSTYGGIPLRIIETDGAGVDILGFNEANKAATGNDTSSIYAIKFGAEQYVGGLRNGGVNVRDLGEIDEKPVFRTRIEFYCGMAVFHPRAAGRLKFVKKGVPEPEQPQT